MFRNYGKIWVAFLLIGVVGSTDRGLYAGGLVDQDLGGWNQWRGADRTGWALGGAWPSDLSENSLNERWRTDRLGESYSGPISDGEKVFTTLSKDGFESVVAYDLQSGEETWRTSWEGEMKVPFFAAKNGSWIRSTPAFSDGRLFVGGMKDHLVCLDAVSGKRLWEINFPQDLQTPSPDFGFVSSPMVHKGHVYVQAGAGFCKVDAKTGNIVWRALVDKGGMYGSAFSSPVVAEFGGVEQVLVQTRNELVGVSTDFGGALWKKPIKAFRGMNILTPLVVENAIFTSSYGGGSLRVEIAQADGAWDASEEWSNRAQAYMCSPVAIDGAVYLHMRNQRFASYDLESGEENWVSDRGFGKYMSLIAKGNQVLALDERGSLFLFEVSPEKLSFVDERKVSEESCWAHLALIKDKLLIRSLNHLMAFDIGPSTL